MLTPIMMIPLGLFFDIGGPTIEEIILRDFTGEFDNNRNFGLVDTRLLQDNHVEKDDKEEKDADL